MKKNRTNTRFTNRVADLFDGKIAIATAGLWHVMVALLVFATGKLGIFSQQFDRDGMGKFALDGYSIRSRASSLVEILLSDGPVSWLKYPAELHVKLYSLCYMVFRPLLGSSILAIEPLNLLYYLGILILTFGLAKEIAGRRAAFLSCAIVGLWPSLLLHTTQFLRDPLYIAAMLALVLVLTRLFTRVYSPVKALMVGLLGGLVGILLLIARPKAWLLVCAIILSALILFFLKMLSNRKRLTINLIGIVVLFLVMTFTLSLFSLTRYLNSTSPSTRAATRPLWSRIATARHGFTIQKTGQASSIIDGNVVFLSMSDTVKYIPRALEIGFLAPFPRMWFSPGYNVGIIGRLIAGVETSLTYVIELLACAFVWQKRRCLHVWLLALTVTTGVTALGLVVANVGTLYRMRYGFWVLLTILGTAELLKLLEGNPSHSSFRARGNNTTTSVV